MTKSIKSFLEQKVGKIKTGTIWSEAYLAWWRRQPENCGLNLPAPLTAGLFYNQALVLNMTFERCHSRKATRPRYITAGENQKYMAIPKFFGYVHNDEDQLVNHSVAAVPPAGRPDGSGRGGSGDESGDIGGAGRTWLCHKINFCSCLRLPKRETR